MAHAGLSRPNCVFYEPWSKHNETVLNEDTKRANYERERLILELNFELALVKCELAQHLCLSLLSVSTV